MGGHFLLRKNTYFITFIANYAFLRCIRSIYSCIFTASNKQTHKAMNTIAQHIVIFDGSSHFVESFDYELGEDEIIVGRFYKIDDAQKCADKLNEKCIDIVH